MRPFPSACSLAGVWQAACRCLRPPARPDAGPQSGPEPVRAAMRALLAQVIPARAQRLARAIEASADLRGLWFLRGELMQALAAQVGEAEARRAVGALDSLFRNGWPQAPVSRSAVLR